VVFYLLRNIRVGFYVFDVPGFSSPALATSDQAYIRFHRHDHLSSGRCPEEDSADWTGGLRNLSPGLQNIYVYFNNDAGGNDIENAVT
jgi:uncharacterized protein YecE (DUF72 family)